MSRISFLAKKFLQTCNEEKNDTGLLAELEKLLENVENQLENFKKKKQDKSQSDDIVKAVVGFLNDPINQYFYIKNTESFVKYNGDNYSRVNEDEIWQNIYTFLKGCNPSIKHSAKNAILENIENKSIFTSIPESKTIQSVISFLYPTIFNSKEEAKYFLSVVGDNILKKNRNIIHYFSIDSKSFITALNDNIYDYTNTFSNTTIKWRCYRHKFSDCRMLKFNKAVLSSRYWHSFIKNYTLDIMAVSTHYSDRYNGSENFIRNNFTDSNVKNYILYLKDKTEKDVVNDFVKSCFHTSTESFDWDVIYFVWKRYLRNNHYPNFLFIEPLKECVKISYEYKQDDDTFLNIGSPLLTKISKFKSFWKETISESKEPFSNYEIGEICELYRQWVNNCTELLLSQDTINHILEYFYSIRSIKDKYISGINCSLWCKWLDINEWIQNYKQNYNKEVTKISISSLYQSYCTFKMQNVKNNMQNNSVSKDYFTKYLQVNIPTNFIFENMIDHSYFNI